MAWDPVFYDLIIFVPFFNRSIQAIDYTTIRTYTTTDNGGTTSDVQEIVARYAWFNKLNPDWQNQTVNFDYVSQFLLPGEQTIPVPLGAETVRFDLIVETGAVDYWWGSKNIAKFGAFGFSYQGSVYGPLNYINTVQSIWKAGAFALNDAIYVNLQPGVGGHILFTSPGGSNPTLTDIPPVQYSTSDPYALQWAPNFTGDPLQPGATFLGPVVPSSGLSPNYVP